MLLDEFKYSAVGTLERKLLHLVKGPMRVVLRCRPIWLCDSVSGSRNSLIMRRILSENIKVFCFVGIRIKDIKSGKESWRYNVECLKYYKIKVRHVFRRP